MGPKSNHGQTILFRQMSNVDDYSKLSRTLKKSNYLLLRLITNGFIIVWGVGGLTTFIIQKLFV